MLKVSIHLIIMTTSAIQCFAQEGQSKAIWSEDGCNLEESICLSPILKLEVQKNRASWRDCQNSCLLTEKARWFTWDKVTRFCGCFESSDQRGSGNGLDLVTGPVICEQRNCSHHGICRGGKILGINQASSRMCQDFCRSDDQCEWFTYLPNKNTPFCIKYSNCPELSSEDCPLCLTSSLPCSDPEIIQYRKEKNKEILGNVPTTSSPPPSLKSKPKSFLDDDDEDDEYDYVYNYEFRVPKNRSEIVVNRSDKNINVTRTKVEEASEIVTPDNVNPPQNVTNPKSETKQEAGILEIKEVIRQKPDTRTGLDVIPGATERDAEIIQPKELERPITITNPKNDTFIEGSYNNKGDISKNSDIVNNNNNSNTKHNGKDDRSTIVEQPLSPGLSDASSKVTNNSDGVDEDVSSSIVENNSNQEGRDGSINSYKPNIYSNINEAGIIKNDNEARINSNNEASNINNDSDFDPKSTASIVFENSARGNFRIAVDDTAATSQLPPPEETTIDERPVPPTQRGRPIRGSKNRDSKFRSRRAYVPESIPESEEPVTYDNVYESGEAE